MLEALVALVAEHGPIVLLIDDLQWGDTKTLAALGYLQRRGAGLAAALVTTVRGTRTSANDQLRRLAPDTLLRLEPLSRGDLAPLGIPDLYESTGGNPRFVAEALANGSPTGPSTHAERGAARAVPRGGRVGLSRPRRRLRCRATVRARAARRRARR